MNLKNCRSNTEELPDGNDNPNELNPAGWVDRKMIAIDDQTGPIAEQSGFLGSYEGIPEAHLIPKKRVTELTELEVQYGWHEDYHYR